MLQIITENENGIIFKSTNLPPIFNVYILKGHKFSDGTFAWKLGIEKENDINKYFIFDSIRGTKQDAVEKMYSLIDSTAINSNT